MFVLTPWATNENHKKKINPKERKEETNWYPKKKVGKKRRRNLASGVSIHKKTNRENELKFKKSNHCIFKMEGSFGNSSN